MGLERGRHPRNVEIREFHRHAGLHELDRKAMNESGIRRARGTVFNFRFINFN